MATVDKLLQDQQRATVVFQSRQNNEVQEESRETFVDLIPQLLASCLMYLLVIQAGINMSFSSVLITQLADNGEIELDTNSASVIASIWSLALPIGALSSGF